MSTAPTTTTPVVLPDLNLLQGPVLLGAAINVLLLGIMVLQCQIYFEQFRQDKKWLKATIWLLLVLDVWSSIACMGMAYTSLISNVGKKVSRIDVWFLQYPVITGLTALIVQLFFAWRTLILTKIKPLAILIAFLSFVQFCGSIGTTIGAHIVGTRVRIGEIASISLVWLLGSLVTDVLITGTLVGYLSKAKAGYVASDRLYNKIIRLTIQTGLLTSSFAIATTVCYILNSKTTTLHLLFGLPLSKLYTNSLMSSLNARREWSGKGLASSSQVVSAENGGRSRVRVNVHQDIYHSNVYPEQGRTTQDEYGNSHELAFADTFNQSENGEEKGSMKTGDKSIPLV